MTANLHKRKAAQLEALETIAWRTLSQPGRSPQQTACDEHEALTYIALTLGDIRAEAFAGGND